MRDNERFPMYTNSTGRNWEMKNYSIKQKTIGIFLVLILVVVGAGLFIIHSLGKAKEDADITNALGRLRMLSQSMGKSALGSAMAKSRKKTIEQNVVSLNRYITKMRAVYTRDVIVPAKRSKIDVSMDPANEPHPAVPFPATFTRMVNAKFGEGHIFGIDIINEDPVNPEKVLKTGLDKDAYSFLKNSPDKVFSKVYEEDGKLFMGLYTADRATVNACVACHIALKGKQFKIGDMLGIRSFKLLYSDDVGLGRSELKASMDEFKQSRNVFNKTIVAMKNGGEYPLNLAMTMHKTVAPLPGEAAQNKLNQVDKKFKELVRNVDNLMGSEVNSLPYRKAQQKILVNSNQLRTFSNDLVEIFTNHAAQNQQSIQVSVIFAIILTIIIVGVAYYYLATFVVQPIGGISKKLGEVSKGNFVQDKLTVTSGDEIGELSKTYNTMLDTMNDIVNQAEDIAAGNLDKEYELKGDLAHAFGKMVQELKDKHKADAKFKELALERDRHSQDLQKKVDNMLQVVSAAAKGDLTRKVAVTGKDAIGQMGNGLLIFFKKLSESMAAISQTANALARSSKEISSAVQDQANVASEQSSSVTEISSTVEELAASSTMVAENANSVAEISKNALNESERGMQAIDALKAKIDGISEDNDASIKEIVDLGKKSNEIGKVMEIINNIADQTKLIAFNAAIEASSAGEAGKRFGVVAVEIRRLADNVMESTGEIQSKIDEIQQAINRLVINSEKGSKRIQEGTDLAGQTFSELERLVAGAKSASDAASQISLSTQQQKTATNQVLAALKEIVSGTKQSSSAITQTSSVTAKLSDMSNELRAMVNKFKINTQG